MQLIINQLFSNKIDSSKEAKVFKKLNYKRIIVQDSTIVKLPSSLYETFKGVSNKCSKSANARIQVVYDILSEQFLTFSVDSYSITDQKAAPDLKIKEGDLVLRDRGYLTFAEIKRHIEEGADCIYRLKFKMNLLDVKTHKVIDLVKLLKRKPYLDMEVCLNDKDRTVVRIVSAPVSEQVAADRRRKAKKESHGKNPSDTFLEFLGWNIFITTINNKQIAYDELFKLYALRWRIETIFKSWKSYLNLTRYNNISDIQLSILLMGRFFMAILFTQFFYHKCRILVSEKYQRDISLMKLFEFLTTNLGKVVLFAKALNDNNQQHRDKLLSKLKKHCCYDIRSDRQNYQQQLNTVLCLS